MNTNRNENEKVDFIKTLHLVGYYNNNPFHQAAYAVNLTQEDVYLVEKDGSVTKGTYRENGNLITLEFQGHCHNHGIRFAFHKAENKARFITGLHAYDSGGSGALNVDLMKVLIEYKTDLMNDLSQDSSGIGMGG